MDLITTHLNADFDGLASMVAARKLYPGAVLAFPGGAQESVRNFLARHDLGVVRVKDVDVDQVTRLVVVDTHEAERLGPFASLMTKPGVALHVYDHHPDTDREKPSRQSLPGDVRCLESVGATTTLLTHRLHEKQLPIAPFEATVLALGLYEETGCFTFSSTQPRDLEAGALVLAAGADLLLVADTLRRNVDPEQITLLHDLLQNSETLYLNNLKVLLVSSTYDRYRGDLAEVVRILAELPGVDAVVSAITMDEKVSVIGRSRRLEVDVASLMNEFGGGGHASAASASVKGQTVVAVRERLRQLLMDRYRSLLLAREVMTVPVISMSQKATVLDAERKLTQYQINVLPVLGPQKKFAGLLSRETVQKALFHNLGKVSIADLIQREVFTAERDTPFKDIQARMIEHNQRFVPILEHQRVVGVITRTDLLRTLHQDLDVSSLPKRKGAALPAPVLKRNLQGKIEQELPATVVHLLTTVGRYADRTGLSLYAVGGFVRDLLLGRKNLDVDLVIEGDGIAFAKEVAKVVGATVKIHDRFGTAVLIMPDGFKLDIATARTEYYEFPTALPTVEQSSLKKDLYRRDFTINALAVRLNEKHFGDLIDFYGGQRDLNDKMIRVLHNLSFIEDPTRVFRAIRFEQRFGFRLGKETTALIKNAEKMGLFQRLSPSRMLQELILLLSDEEPRKGLSRLAEFNLLRFIHPDLQKAGSLSSLLKSVEDALGWYRLLYLDRPIESWVVYMMALVNKLPARTVGEVLRRLRVPRRQAEKIKEGRFHTDRLLQQLGKRSVLCPSAVVRFLEGCSCEALLFAMAKAKSETPKRYISAYVTSYRTVKPWTTGADLQRMGLKPGPIFKKVLDRLRDERLDGRLTTEKTEREFVKRLIAQQKGKSA